jgi:hypothetical protein
MIKTLIYAVLSLALLHSQSALAHDGGHGPVSEKQAIIIASQIARQFTLQDPGLGFGKLSNDWSRLPLEAKGVHEKGDGYYIISLNNKAKSKTLYILMSVSGQVYDANLTGEFPALKKTTKNKSTSKDVSDK